MSDPHPYSIDQIKAMLTARAGDVARAYAPPVATSYEDRGDYWTLNPYRADRTVGSFVVHLTGPRAGTWRDFATHEGGDLLDLIKLSMATDNAGAIKEARGFLGLVNEHPDAVRRRRAKADELKARQVEADTRSKDEARRVAGVAKAMFLAGLPIEGTPVEHYLRDSRGIDFATLGRTPRSLRYLKSAFYQHTDRETGEVIEGRWPCMVAMVVGRDGKTTAVHRTWLAIDPGTGRWSKAPVPNPKKVLGTYRGAAIRVWSGWGPKGGKPSRLAEVPPGSALMIAEGIEDALSAAMLVPEARILAGISLGNLAAVELPPNISEVTIIGDRDAAPGARAVLDAAIERHAAQGRTVRLWQNDWGGKDLNDALRQALQEDVA